MNELLRAILFLPEQASTMAYRVDRLHYFVIITTMIMSCAVAITALAFFVKFHRKRPDQRTPHVESSLGVEVLFIGAPLLFFLTFFAIGFRDYVQLETPPPNAMDVYVMGKQWMWKYAYPEGPSSVGTLYVPAHRPVRLLLTSRDVIHSFYVPSFRIKQDAVPGRYTQAWFEATSPGHYQVLCAEYCGAAHSVMWGEIVALEPAEFDAWMDERKRGLAGKQDGVTAAEPRGSSMVERGVKAAAELGCLRCHTLDGTPHIGPTWLGLYRKRDRMTNGEILEADEAYLTESMMDPLARVVDGFAPVMPSYRGRMTAPDTAAILELIKSLRPERETTAPPAEPGPAGPVTVVDAGPTEPPVREAPAPAAETQVDRGRRLAAQLACLGCHSLDGTRGVGPTWLGIWGRQEKTTNGELVTVDEAYVTESILDPGAKVVEGFAPAMPPYRDRISPEDIAAIVAFMKDLRPDRGDAGAEAGGARP